MVVLLVAHKIYASILNETGILVINAYIFRFYIVNFYYNITLTGVLIFVVIIMYVRTEWLYFQFGTWKTIIYTFNKGS